MSFVAGFAESLRSPIADAAKVADEAKNEQPEQARKGDHNSTVP